MNVSTNDIPTIRSASPFRYPGGKAFLYRYLINRVRELKISRRYYAEPFCGGGGAATILLKLNEVDEIHLNDADPKVYSAWRAILDEPRRFEQAVMEAPLDMDTWYKYRAIVDNSVENSFDLGFATFYLNRTNRSGIVMGSGPIGGYEQKGKWKIDARFNREVLAERVRWLGSMKERIILTQEDALTFLSKSTNRLPKHQTFFFIDPPYVVAGGRLYLNAMTEGKHIALSDLLQSNILPHWALTYDDHPLIRSLYQDQKLQDLAVTYSLQSKRKEKEILINYYSDIA